MQVAMATSEPKEPKNWETPAGEDDPAIEFQLNSDAHIHACLQMPAVTAGLPQNVPALVAGVTPAQSRLNLIIWLDDLVDSSCRAPKRVRDEIGVVCPGSYDHIMGYEYSLILTDNFFF